MKRKYFNFGLLGIAALASQSCHHQVEKKPNIILILADDMGYSDLGCYGSEIKTPNLDSLAANGIRYRQFYNGARSCPSRAALMTGMYCHKAGVGWMDYDQGVEGYKGGLNNHCVTIAQVLKPAGYSTYMTGKWHIMHWREQMPDGPRGNRPPQRGFDRFYGILGGGGSYFNPDLFVQNNIIKSGNGFYVTDAIADSAVKFIDEHNTTNPFFCYVAFTSPHWPLHAKEQDIAKYMKKYSIGWDSLRNERFKKMKKMGVLLPDVQLSPRDETVPAWKDITAKDRALWIKRMAIYAAQIDCMDQGIGRIIEELKKKGMLENTLIMFLSDNGGCAEEISRGDTSYALLGKNESHESYRINWTNMSNTPFREYKHWTHEGGISTPFIMHWPAGISAKNIFTDQIGHITDIMATCKELSGAVYPDTFKGEKIYSLDGKSLVPVMKGQTFDHGYIFWEHEANRAVRFGKWKLVSKGNAVEPYAGKWELYDMEKDRAELHDLSAENHDLVKQLSEEWQKWAEKSFVLPLDNRDWGSRAKEENK
jgi:arylsulfatase A-like enzyme